LTSHQIGSLLPFAPSLSAVAVLTLFAVIILVCAGRLTKQPVVLTALGLLATILAAIPALASGSNELTAVVGIASVATLAILLLPGLELQDGGQQPELAALLLLGSAGAIVLATADDLLSLVLGLETLSLSVAVATALGRGVRPLEAAFKYFVLAAVSVAAMIYGIGLFVLATGSLSLSASAPGDPALQLLYTAGIVLVALGFGFELAVVPLHWGALDAYIAAAPGLAGFIMSASKLGAALALGRLLVAVGPEIAQPVLVGVGILSIGWGTIGALAQRDLRGLLGYSAIAHAGFLALALASGADGRVAAVFYVVIYAATAMLVFASLSGLGTGPIPLDALSVSGLGPLRGLALSLGLLSLAGIPPTPGFWAKLAMLGPAWAVAGPFPTIVAAVGAVAGALYYLRPLPDLLATIRAAAPQPSLPLAGAAMAIAGAAVILFGLVPGLAHALASLSQLRA
jgi:NADH-quinone oxidoreductase subunit N